MGDSFDGDAISRADRKFLASLGNHELKQNPLYGTPRPPLPEFGTFDATDQAQTAARLAFHGEVVHWMLANYAYREGAFVSKGGAISLVDGEIISLPDLRGRMAPRALIHITRNGTIKARSPVEDWMLADFRRSIRREEMRPDQPRPTFKEDGYDIFNRYRPPAHPTARGEIETFKDFFAHLIPDATERAWKWNWLAHKVRRPWVPMLAIIMVAAEFGSGRGTLFDLLELLFGKDYVVPCVFAELTGKGALARFNDRTANALFAVINEAVDEDGHSQAHRRLTYEALKNAIDPSPTARRRFEEKYQRAYAQRSAMSAIIATQHPDVVKMPRDDRRFCVITCGGRMTAAQTATIRAWMAKPENIGALYRALLATPAAPLDVFNPMDYPPPFAGRLEMIGMAKSAVEDAFEAGIEALDGYPLFTLPQMLRLITYFGGASGSEGNERAKYTITKNAFRLRARGASGAANGA